MDNSSSISAIGGHVDTTYQASPEADLSYFLTDNIAFEVIAATTHHHVAGQGTALGKVDVGSAWAVVTQFEIERCLTIQAYCPSPHVVAMVTTTGRIEHGKRTARGSSPR
jgi:hypothetical protein